MASFGDKLRLEREKGNLSVEEIAARTEIDPRFLRALEQDEFDSLPGKAFGKFYIRAYAEILGFDPRTLISDYDAEQRRRRQPADGGHVVRERPRRRVEAALERWRASLTTGPDAGPEEPTSATEPETDGEIRGGDEPTDAGREDATETPVASDSALDSEVEPVQSEPHRAAEPAEPDMGPVAECEPSPPSTLDAQTASPRADVEAASGSAEASSRIDAEAGADEKATASKDDVSSVPPVAHDEAAAMATILGTSPAQPREDRHRRVPRLPLVLAGLALAAIVVLALFVGRGGAAPTEEPVPVDSRSSSDAAAPSGAVLSEEVATGVGRSEPRSAAATGSGLPLESRPSRTDAASAPVDATTARPAAPHPVPGSAETTPRSLAVTELGVGSRIVNHLLEGRAERFDQGSVVVFWTRVEGGSRGETIRHVWLYRGRIVQSVPLELGGPHWRTFSRKTLGETGEWAVEVRDAAGQVLARTEFVCVARAR